MVTNRLRALGWGALAALVFAGCPLMLPTGGVEIVASPELYLPVDLPADFEIDFDLGRIAAIAPGDLSSDSFAMYDYPGGYPDTVAFIAVTQLFDQDLSGSLNDALAALPPYIPQSLIDRQPVDLDLLNSGIKTIDVSSLMAPLTAYPLDFRVVNAYLYVDGPPALFTGNAIQVTNLMANSTPLLTGAIGRVPLPALPASGAPVEKPLRPVPAPMPLAGVFNGPPRPSNIELAYEINIAGRITIGDLRRNPHVSAYLVLEMPLVFVITANFPVPVNAAQPETKIAISDGVFADAGADEIINRLEHLTLETAIKNNIGIAGFVSVNSGDYGSAVPLGRINLDGPSTLRIAKTTIENNRPFPLWAEIVLEAGQFINIKRQNDPAHTKPLEMNLAVRVKTSLHERF